MKHCNLEQICWKNVVRGFPVRSCTQNLKVPSKGEWITEQQCFPSFAQDSPHFTNESQDIARNTVRHQNVPVGLNELKLSEMKFGLLIR